MKEIELKSSIKYALQTMAYSHMTTGEIAERIIDSKAIEQYVEDRIIEARIEELEKLDEWAVGRYFRRALGQRIGDLESQLKAQRGKG